MTTATLAGFLSKKEIEASYGRSFRSLTRDITRAVRAGDTDILRHLKLVTEDEKVRKGSDVTLDMIQELSNDGLRPMWLAEESWVADWCKVRPGQRRDVFERTEVETGSAPVIQSPNDDSRATSTPTTPASVELLHQRIEDQKQQINMLRGQLEIKDEQIRTANQLAEQSQHLMRDLHVLLSNVQGGTLGEGSLRRIATRAATAKPREPAPQPVVVRAEQSTERPSRRPAKLRPAKKIVRGPTTSKQSDFGRPAADRLRSWFPTFLGPKRPGNK